MESAVCHVKKKVYSELGHLICPPEPYITSSKYYPDSSHKLEDVIDFIEYRIVANNKSRFRVSRTLGWVDESLYWCFTLGQYDSNDEWDFTNQASLAGFEWSKKPLKRLENSWMDIACDLPVRMKIIIFDEEYNIIARGDASHLWVNLVCNLSEKNKIQTSLI